MPVKRVSIMLVPIKTAFWSMYKAAAGAGVLIAIMATLKTLASRLVLASDDAGLSSTV